MSLTPRAVKVTPIKDTMQDQIGSVDHLCATGAGTSWLCRALQQNSGRGSHQLQKAGGSEERQEKAAQRHMNSKRSTHILSEMKVRLKKVNDMHQDNSNILFTCHSSVK